jgi:hypothetical protein
MPNVPTRRIGLALLVASTIFTMVTASAANLVLNAPATVGAGDQAISAPCDHVDATYTIAYRSVPNAYFVDAVVLTGDTCVGDGLTVRVTLGDGATNPETTEPAVTSAALMAGLTIDVSADDVMAEDLVGVAVLVTGS